MSENLPPKPIGECPVTPDVPFNEDLYDAVIAAMDALIARGKEPKADEPEEMA